MIRKSSGSTESSSTFVFASTYAHVCKRATKVPEASLNCAVQAEVLRLAVGNNSLSTSVRATQRCDSKVYTKPNSFDFLQFITTTIHNQFQEQDNKYIS